MDLLKIQQRRVQIMNIDYSQFYRGYCRMSVYLGRVKSWIEFIAGS